MDLLQFSSSYIWLFWLAGTHMFPRGRSRSWFAAQTPTSFKTVSTTCSFTEWRPLSFLWWPRLRGPCLRCRVNIMSLLLLSSIFCWSPVLSFLYQGGVPSSGWLDANQNGYYTFTLSNNNSAVSVSVTPLSGIGIIAAALIYFRWRGPLHVQHKHAAWLVCSGQWRAHCI